MQSLVRSAREVYRHDGPLSVFKWGLKWGAWRIGLNNVYQQFVSDHLVLPLDDLSVSFASSGASVFYDFTDDFESEKDIVSEVLDAVEGGDVFYDIGANIGLYACFVGTASDDIDVVAFEPSHRASSELRKNIELNRLDVQIRSEALSDECGTASFVDEGLTQNHLQSRAETGTADATEVPIVTGDSLVDDGETPHPTVAKIDVEGAEMQVLQGLDAELSRPEFRTVFCEVHPRKLPEYDSSPEEVEQFLRERGFSLETLYERRSQYYLKAVKDDHEE